MLAQILSLSLTYVFNSRRKQLIFGRNPQFYLLKISTLTVLKITVSLDLMSIISICFRHLFASKISLGSVKKLALYNITHLRELTAFFDSASVCQKKRSRPWVTWMWCVLCSNSANWLKYFYWFGGANISISQNLLLGLTG